MSKGKKQGDVLDIGTRLPEQQSVTILIMGPIGSGKTTLLRKIAELCLENGHIVHCWDDGQKQPFKTQLDDTVPDRLRPIIHIETATLRQSYREP